MRCASERDEWKNPHNTCKSVIVGMNRGEMTACFLWCHAYGFMLGNSVTFLMHDMKWQRLSKFPFEQQDISNWIVLSPFRFRDAHARFPFRFSRVFFFRNPSLSFCLSMSRLYHYCQQYEIDSKPTAEPFDGYMSNQPPSKCIHIVYCPKTKKNPIDAAIDRADLFVYFEFLFREKRREP